MLFLFFSSLRQHLTQIRTELISHTSRELGSHPLHFFETHTPTSLAMANRKSWKTGIISCVVVTTACTLLVLTAKGFNRLMTEENCHSAMCHLQPWWEHTVYQSSAEIPTPLSTVSPSGMTTDAPHMQLKRETSNATGNPTETPTEKTEKTAVETTAVEIPSCELTSCEHTQSNDPGRGMAQGTTAETVPLGDDSKSEHGMDQIEEESQSQFGCLNNGDCGLGYECFEGRCRPGCSKHQDCPFGYECRYGRYGYRCFEKTGWHRECREHLRFCNRHGQCCSGWCGRGRGKGKGVLMCRKIDA